MITLLAPLLGILGPAAVLLVMAIVFAETGLLAGFFLPGDSLLFLTGLLVAGAVIHLPMVAVLAGVSLAAILGDQVGYLMGRRFGPRVFSRTRSRLLAPAHLERAERFFAGHGPVSVLLARFVPVARTFVPVLAGVGKMPRRRFTTYSIAGALTWVTLLTLSGFFLGSVAFVAQHVELIVLGVVAVSLVPAGIAVLRQRSRPNGAHTSRRRWINNAVPATTSRTTPAA